MKALIVEGLLRLAKWLAGEAADKIEEKLSDRKEAALGARSTVRKYGKRVN